MFEGKGGINIDQYDCSRKIATEIRDLGVFPGDTVLVHSSLKSLGNVPGGIETVIQGFLLAIGPDGTLLMPALSGALQSPGFFDVKLVPTNIGAVPEYFRTRDGTYRSLNPSHSACAVGRRSHELLDDHRLDCTPCGQHSPFRKVAETKTGKIVMLGCGLDTNTTMHALDAYYNDPAYLCAPVLFTLKDWQGNIHQKEYKLHGPGSCVQRYDRVLDLDSGSFLRRGKVLQAATFVLSAPGLKNAVLKKLKENPDFFVDQKKLHFLTRS